MSGAIPEKYRDLFSKRAFASLGTVMPDGRPQVTPVWCDLEGDLVVFNSAKGRQKDRNVRRDPRVAIAIVDPENPYRYLEIRGRVVEITEQGADAHHGPAVGPVPLPGMLLALGPVDLLQAEEPPADIQVQLVAHISHPQ